MRRHKTSDGPHRGGAGRLKVKTFTGGSYVLGKQTTDRGSALNWWFSALRVWCGVLLLTLTSRPKWS